MACGPWRDTLRLQKTTEFVNPPPSSVFPPTSIESLLTIVQLQRGYELRACLSRIRLEDRQLDRQTCRQSERQRAAIEIVLLSAVVDL